MPVGTVVVRCEPACPAFMRVSIPGRFAVAPVLRAVIYL